MIKLTTATVGLPSNAAVPSGGTRRDPATAPVAGRGHQPGAVAPRRRCRGCRPRRSRPSARNERRAATAGDGGEGRIRLRRSQQGEEGIQEEEDHDIAARTAMDNNGFSAMGMDAAGKMVAERCRR